MLIVIALGARFINGCNNVVWSAAAILTRFGPFWPIMATVPMVTAVIVVSVVGSLVTVASWAMSARILVEVHLGFLGVDVLVGGCDHLADPRGWLMVELRAKLAVMESSDEGGDDLCFCDVGNRIPHLRKSFDVATEELGRFLVDAIQIVLGARPSTRSHVVVGGDLLQLFPRF